MINLFYHMKVFTPLWFALCSMTSSTTGFSGIALKRQLKQYIDLSLNKRFSMPMLEAAKKKKGILELEPLEMFQSAESTPKRKIKTFQAKTENQQSYIDWMRDDSVDIVVAIGPAGTGKTMLACYAAVEALRLKQINKIVITRPVVSVDEEIGFLPGGVASKMDPWTRPVFDVLRETYSAKEIERMMEEGVLEIVPLGFMRGRTFKHAWIVADEMQNSSPTQMLMLATRIGEGSKMIITGDLNQSDRPGPNGLQEIYSKLESASDIECIKVITLETEDVQRSRAAKAVLNLYEGLSIEPHNPPCEDRVETLPEGSNVEILQEGSNVETLQDGSYGEVEWIELNDNDAALIPKRHYYASNARKL